MDSSMSLIIVDIVLQDLEKLAIKKLPTQFYLRYLDEIVLAAPNS